jgi:hypothetical protein
MNLLAQCRPNSRRQTQRIESERHAAGSRPALATSVDSDRSTYVRDGTRLLLCMCKRLLFDDKHTKRHVQFSAQFLKRSIDVIYWCCRDTDRRVRMSAGNAMVYGEFHSGKIRVHFWLTCRLLCDITRLSVRSSSLSSSNIRLATVRSTAMPNGCRNEL